MDLRPDPPTDDELATTVLRPKAAHTEVVGHETARWDGRDALGWAKCVWEDRDAWLSSRGGVESVFVAAQLLGCREEAVAWLRGRTRL